MNKNFEYMSFDNLNTYDIKERKNLVNIKKFAKLTKEDSNFSNFLDFLPDIYAGADLKSFINKMVLAVKNDKIIGAGIGGHVIKCGLSPILIELMEKKILKCLIMAGAGSIHDYEIALIGETSEDVGDSLSLGKFGMAKETAIAYREAAKKISKSKGLGRALGELILEKDLPYAKYSVLATAAKLDIPICIFIAMGNDIVHMHPNFPASEIGYGSYLDFRLFTSVISQLNNGIWMNIGSAVVLPEVFLKAISICCNMGYNLDKLTTANFDMINHYRPRQNVVSRPPGKGYNFIGHHEIMIPLLRTILIKKLQEK